MSTGVESRQADIVGLAPAKRPWRQVIWTAAVLLVLAIFLATFYKQNFVGLTDRHSLDVAQIARNVASGNGFTTHFLRPFNVALAGDQSLQNRELNTAPAFPYAVAAVFRLRSPSDQCVAWVSMLFLLLTIGGTYLLGRLLFDWRVGLMSAAVLGTSASVLETAASGTEWTMAGFVLVTVLVLIALHHRSTIHDGGAAGVVYPAACGILLALMYMTAHMLLFLAIPLAVYFGVTGKRRRFHLAVFVLVVILAAAPWGYRNVVCTHGSVLGANAWDIMSHSTAFPGDTLYRSTDGDNLSVLRAVFFPVERFWPFVAKLMTGFSGVLQSLMTVLGLAMLPFALVSVLYRFRPPTANAVRGLFYGVGAVLTASFAVFSVDAKAVVLLAPVIAVFGSAYFLLLLQAKKLHPIYSRAITFCLLLISCWPALSTAVWQTDVDAAKKLISSSMMIRDSFDGILYTDVPWAIAWRTNGVGVWLPCRDEDVYELDAKGLPLSNAILTTECDTYQPDDTWYMLHKFQFWRDYLRDPAGAASRAQITGFAAQPSVTIEQVERELRERKRQLPIQESISGCTAQRFRGLAPDEFILVSCPPR